MFGSLIDCLKFTTRRAWGINGLHRRIDALERVMDRDRRDLLVALAKRFDLFPDPGVVLDTAFPIAVDSTDHRNPFGTRYDNTRYPRFCYCCEQVFRKPVRFLDIGCAGGGLVLDFLLRGHFAIGIEGSDYSLKDQRAEWRLLPKHLFTCDATKPFNLEYRSSGERIKFDVVSAWEVLEHIAEGDLPQFFANILSHLADGGIFAASVATVEHRDEKLNVRWHATVKPREWWFKAVTDAGFEQIGGLFQARDFPRQGGGAWSSEMDWDTPGNTSGGFHLVLRRRDGGRV